eukprot:tig00000158_g10139.t1
MAARCPGVGKQPRIRSVQNQDASAAFRARVSHQEWIGSAGSVGPKTAAVHSCLNRGAGATQLSQPSPDARYSYLNSRWLTRKRSDARRWRQLRHTSLQQRLPEPGVSPPSAAAASLQLGRQRRRAALAALLSRHAARSRPAPSPASPALLDLALAPPPAPLEPALRASLLVGGAGRRPVRGSRGGPDRALEPPPAAPSAATLRLASGPVPSFVDPAARH